MLVPLVYAPLLPLRKSCSAIQCVIDSASQTQQECDTAVAEYHAYQQHFIKS